MPILDSDFAAGGRGHQGGPGVARGHGQARLPRRQQDPDLPDHRGRVRGGRRRPAADGPGARLRPGPRARPGLGAPGRRRGRLRGPDREEGLQGHRRVRAAGAAGIRRLRRRGRPRPAPDHAEADRDHPAGGAELHPGRLRAALAGLVDADRLRRPRGADPAPGQPARTRPVLYRASIPEMVVPYGDPKFRYWQAYFDTGEYLVGKLANSLELGCDCLGEIAYLDATVTDDTGQPRTIRTRSASTRKTSASCGSTPTSSTARPSPAASAGSWSPTSPRWATTTTASTGTSTWTARSSARSRRPGCCSPRPTRAPGHPYSTEVAPGLAARGAPAPVQRPAGHDRGRAGQRGGGGRRQRPADRPGQPVRQRHRAER